MPTSLRFYIDQLGFALVEQSPHLGGDPYRFHWCWLRLRRHREACLFFGCPDVDAAYAELTARGVVIDRPPKVAPYGMKQVYFKDPDGFGLCFQWKADRDALPVTPGAG